MVVQFQTRQHEPDVTSMEFTGQLTLGNSLVEVEHAIKDRIQAGCRKLVLDLMNLSFLDSAGLGVLVVCSSVMEQAGGRLAVVGAGGKVKQVLEITHVNKVIGMYPDLASALARLAELPTPAADASTMA